MKKYSRGFTLIETLIALVITVAAGLLISNAWSSNYLRTRKTAINNNVALLLERKMVEMESKHSGKKILEISDEEGDFGDSYPQYRWKFSTQPFEMPDLAPILGKQTKAGVDQTLLTLLSKMREVVGKAILEGTVTVFVKAGAKEISYSVTTYFVDYDSETEIGM
jgi:prepilin-type N-terminal cleavage/methylation domain-containing protein